MKDMQFRVLLDLMMVSDPWPLTAEAKIIFLHLMDNESKKHGYDDVITAYHFFQQKVKKALPRKVEKRKPRKVRGVKTNGAGQKAP